ncbi:Glycoside hydrolase family 10 domain [Arabidopsis suecica]|uniref:Glycoside hydrolase family 10 domain n=1 Tax=Arabidopsis suecica TaxID=45249 RepID=A0A8T2E979_ARASU|nr:Glycoside hydrolase family 10 domain [Arabidopsis suecica]
MEKNTNTNHTSDDNNDKNHTNEEQEKIILNPNFEDGLNNWTGRACKIVLHESMDSGKIVPLSGKVFAAATQRKDTWNGIQQEISGRFRRKRVYEVTAVVRIFGNNVTSATVQATLWVLNANKREQYIVIANVQATDKNWVELKGKFVIHGSPSRVILYLEGPPPRADILLNSLVVQHAKRNRPSPPPFYENPGFGVNIVENSEVLDGGTKPWFTLGNCKLSVGQGAPRTLPPMARDTLGPHKPLGGNYIVVTNRTQTWMGPAQMITDKIKLFLTYQISAWVKLGVGVSGSSMSPQNVNIALSVDNQWVNGGQVEVTVGDTWHEIAGSFRLEKQPQNVMVYVQGPGAGIDLMIAALQIFPVDRRERVRCLKRQVDEVRKRDIVLKFSGLNDDESFDLFPYIVKVKQTYNSFPVGTCINRTDIDNEDFVDFFTKNFNWAVFGNELKWYATEAERGKVNYQDADDMLDLCIGNNINVRGHCIFWEVESTVQPWVRQLNKTDLMNAVQKRLTDLLTRYKGKFKHYDVNNEMLHGSFYQDRLGKGVRALMFNIAHKLDPSPLLFVNDYHVEDGDDPRSSPEKYIKLVLDLEAQGATVGGIGIQGHIDSPVGAIVCSALDKLSVLGRPIWFTELDVSSSNEYVRGEDLEVMLWEAFAHPSVEGIMLWGFWELSMSRENANLVEGEGEVNEAGKRFLEVKQEWLSHAYGIINDESEFTFRGYHGTYAVEICTPAGIVLKTFVVEKGDTPLVISIDLSSL